MTTPHHVEGWPCLSLEAANRLRRIFRGDLTASPGRALFARTGAPDLTETRMCSVCDERPADNGKTTCRRCRQEAAMAKVRSSRETPQPTVVSQPVLRPVAFTLEPPSAPMRTDAETRPLLIERLLAGRTLPQARADLDLTRADIARIRLGDVGWWLDVACPALLVSERLQAKQARMAKRVRDGAEVVR